MFVSEEFIAAPILIFGALARIGVALHDDVALDQVAVAYDNERRIERALEHHVVDHACVVAKRNAARERTRRADADESNAAQFWSLALALPANLRTRRAPNAAAGGACIANQAESR